MEEEVRAKSAYLGFGLGLFKMLNEVEEVSGESRRLIDQQSAVGI